MIASSANDSPEERPRDAVPFDAVRILSHGRGFLLWFDEAASGRRLAAFARADLLALHAILTRDASPAGRAAQTAQIFAELAAPGAVVAADALLVRNLAVPLESLCRAVYDGAIPATGLTALLSGARRRSACYGIRRGSLL